MRSFVSLDDLELLDRNVDIGEAGRREVSLLELAQRSFVKLGLEVFKNLRKLCDSNRQPYVTKQSVILLTEDKSLVGRSTPGDWRG